MASVRAHMLEIINVTEVIVRIIVVVVVVVAVPANRMGDLGFRLRLIEL